jgi:hypothetical protein
MSLSAGTSVTSRGPVAAGRELIRLTGVTIPVDAGHLILTGINTAPVT